MFWKFDEEENKVVKKLSKDLLPPDSYQPVPLSIDGEASSVKEETTKDNSNFMSSDETGAEDRFEKRIEVFKKEDKPIYKHHFWWFIHNCIAHPMIGIYPCKFTFNFHDWTSKKINGQ